MARLLRRALTLVTVAAVAVGLAGVAPVQVAVAATAVPVAPVLVAPTANDSIRGNPTFSWERVADATSYRFELSKGAGFVTADKIYTTDTYALSVAPPADLPPVQLFWRVAALNGTVVGPWGPSQFTKVAAAGPDAVEPVNGHSFAYPDEAPVLRWSVLAGVKGYEVEIDDANDFIGAQKSTTANTSLAIGAPLTLDKAWFWRVRGVSATTGVTTDWSSVQSFDLQWSVGDGQPQLLTPANASPIEVTDILFSWTGSNLAAGDSTGVPGAKSYQLQVNPNGDWANNDTENITVKGTQYSPAATYAAGGYFWHVRAIATGPGASAPQYGPWSETFQFTRGWSDKPALVHPIGGVEEDLSAFRFEWNAIAHASSYELWVSADSNMNNPTICKTLHTSLTPNALTTPKAVDCAFEPNPGGTYYWWVRGIDASTLTATAPIIGVWSNQASFVYDQDVVQQLSPAENASVSAPVLRWAPLNGYHHYEVTLVKNGDTTKTTTGSTYSTSWSPTTSSPNLGPGSYEWTVNGISADGTVSPTTGSPWHFTLVDPTATSASFNPLDMRTDFGGHPQDMPSMTWTPITNAAYYRVWSAVGGTTVYTALTRASDKLPQAAFTYSGNTALPVSHRETLPAGDWLWSVQAFSETNVKLAESSVANYTLAASDFVSYLTPADGASKPDVPQLSWTPVVDAYEYRVHVALDANFTHMVNIYTTHFASVTPREALADNQAGSEASYYWYVQVCKSPGSCGPLPQVAYEAGRENISAFSKKSPAPLLVAPVTTESPAAATTVSDQVAFKWNDYFVTDPHAPGARTYRIEVAADSTFTTLIDSADVDQPFYAPWKKSYPTGPLYWRVQALDGSGQRLTFSNNTTPTANFVKVSGVPRDLATQVVTAAKATGQPTLSWSALSHAGSYTVEIYRGQDANYPFVNLVRTDTISYPAFTPELALAAGDYSWRVRKNDVDGNPGLWAGDGQSVANGDTFTVLGPKVTLLTPDPGSGAAPTSLSSDDTTFTWSALPGAASYQFETSTSASFSSTFETAPTVNTSWVSPKYYADGTKYFWRVRALDSTKTTLSTSDAGAFVKNTVSVTLTSASASTKFRGPVDLKAVVARPGKLATGTVTFYDGDTKIANAVTLASGAALLTAKTLAIGVHEITATWSGDSSSGPAVSASLTQTVGPAGAAYTPVTPERVMEERIPGASTSTLELINVPIGATAVALNVTAADPSANTYISVCPGGTSDEDCKASSNINPYRGRTTPNMVIVKLGENNLGEKNAVTFYNNAGVTRVIADLQGWFVEGSDTGATYQPVAPTRAMAGTYVSAGTIHTLTIPNVPAGATAVALNVTAARPTSNTYVSVCPGSTAPTICKASSALNPYLGSDTPNMVIVKLGPNNTVSFYNNAGVVKLIADVQGWFIDGTTTEGSYLPVAPYRAMAFKSLRAAGTANLDLDKNSAGATVTVPVGATAVVLNVTSTRQTINTYISACPYGTVLTACKASSNLNPYTGRDIANTVIVKLGTGNQVTFYNNAGTAQLIADVQGWYVK